MSDKQDNHNAGYKSGYDAARNSNVLGDFANKLVATASRSGNEDYDSGWDNGYKDGVSDRQAYGPRDDDDD